MNDLKAQQRRQAYAARHAQTDKDLISQRICERILMLPAYQQAKTLLWYLHCRSEVQTQTMLLAELATDKRIAIPFCTQDSQGGNSLGLWHLQNFAELVTGTWGILEPPKNRWYEAGKEIAPEQLDVLLVPGVAFDRHGGRLGNGAGYYDRLLPQLRADALVIGICYEAQLFEQCVMEPHDVYMDFVITEQACYPGLGRRGLY